MTTGRISQEHLVLPAVQPWVSLLLIGLSLLPVMYRIWKVRSREVAAVGGLLAGLSFFMFGWHVHEKASLMITIPLIAMSGSRVEIAKCGMLLAVSGQYALLPLFYESRESGFKTVLLGTHTLLLIAFYYSIFSKKFQLSVVEKAYLAGFLFLHFFVSCIHPIYFGTRFPFLGMLLTSFYCALGVTATYLRLYRLFFQLGK